MKQVKGSMAITIIKSIKTSPKGMEPYNEILSDKGRELLNRRILTASWYPFEDYKECYDALCQVEARNNPKTLFEWGLREAKRWLTTVYQSTIAKDDLHVVFDRYTCFHRKIFNFGEITTKFISDTELELTYIDMPHNWPNYYHSAIGWVMCFIELCIGKKADYLYLNKSWKEEGWTKAKFTWDS